MLAVLGHILSFYRHFQSRGKNVPKRHNCCINPSQQQWHWEMDHFWCDVNNWSWCPVSGSFWTLSSVLWVFSVFGKISQKHLPCCIYPSLLQKTPTRWKIFMSFKQLNFFLYFLGVLVSNQGSYEHFKFLWQKKLQIHMPGFNYSSKWQKGLGDGLLMIYFHQLLFLSFLVFWTWLMFLWSFSVLGV